MDQPVPPTPAFPPSRAFSFDTGVWPVGWPFRVKKNFNATPAHGINVISALKNQEGVVLKVFPDGWAQVLIHDRFDVGAVNGTMQGFVPLNRLDVAPSTSRKYGDVRVIDHTIRPAHPVTQQNVDGLLGRTINVYLHALDQNPEIAGHRFEGIKKRYQLDGVLQMLLSGIEEAGFLEYFNNPLFNADEMESLGQSNPYDPDKPHHIIYVRLYRMPDGTVRMYVGHTKDWPTKVISHRSKVLAADPNNEHYKIARNARNGTGLMIPLAYLPELDIIPLAEQLLLNLLQSYRTEVLTWTSGMETEIGDITVAVRLTTLANQSFAQTAWPGTRRPSFAPVPAGGGCNWKSPLTHNDNILVQWTRIDVVTQRGVMACYRRPRARVGLKGEVFRKNWSGYNQSNRDATGTFVIQMDANLTGAKPGKGSYVYCSFEIMEPGVEHHFPYFPLPTVTPQSNREDCMRLACKIEFELNGQWYSRYLQVAQDMSQTMVKVQGDNVPATAWAHWAEVTEFLKYFEHYRWANRPQWYERNAGVADIVLIKFDNYTQTFTYSKHIPSTVTVDFPTLATVQ